MTVLSVVLAHSSDRVWIDKWCFGLSAEEFVVVVGTTVTEVQVMRSCPRCRVAGEVE